jgi:hypothetical protein
MKMIATVFVASAMVGAALGTATPANAWWTRTSAAACYSDKASTTTVGMINVSSSTANVYCPANDTSDTAKYTATTLNIHGYDGHNSKQAAAAACVHYWASNGGACGANSYSGTSFVGNFVLTPTLEYWSSSYAGDFGYIYATLPPNSVYASTVRGIFIAG